LNLFIEQVHSRSSGENLDCSIQRLKKYPVAFGHLHEEHVTSSGAPQEISCLRNDHGWLSPHAPGAPDGPFLGRRRAEMVIPVVQHDFIKDLAAGDTLPPLEDGLSGVKSLGNNETAATVAFHGRPSLDLRGLG